MAVSAAERNRYIDDRAANKAQEDQLRSIARAIVQKSKSEAHVDTGLLKRSINYTINLQGVFTFTEMFYGQFHENSSLEENIKAMWPGDVPYNLIYLDDNGSPYQVVRKNASGRSHVSNATQRTTVKSLGINGIKNFLKALGNANKKKNESSDSGGSNNKETP